jgi:hypothetical protein
LQDTCTAVADAVAGGVTVVAGEVAIEVTGEAWFQ